MLTNVHREWVDGLPELLLDDGAPYPKSQVVPYAYRHSYAQRHANAGTAVDVCSPKFLGTRCCTRPSVITG